MALTRRNFWNRLVGGRIVHWPSVLSGVTPLGGASATSGKGSGPGTPGVPGPPGGGGGPPVVLPGPGGPPPGGTPGPVVVAPGTVLFKDTFKDKPGVLLADHTPDIGTKWEDAYGAHSKASINGGTVAISEFQIRQPVPRVPVQIICDCVLGKAVMSPTAYYEHLVIRRMLSHTFDGPCVLFIGAQVNPATTSPYANLLQANHMFLVEPGPTQPQVLAKVAIPTLTAGTKINATLTFDGAAINAVARVRGKTYTASAMSLWSPMLGDPGGPNFVYSFASTIVSAPRPIDPPGRLVSPARHTFLHNVTITAK